MKSPRLLVALVVLWFGGCASSDVISTGPDTFMVSASSVGFATAGVREKVYKKANDYCADKGLVMVPVSFKAREGELGRNPPSADLVFRALKPGDPAIGRPDILNADVTTQNVRVSVKDESKKEKGSAFYDELIKLDDLKKRGILTEAEFDQAKQKLLQGK